MLRGTHQRMYSQRAREILCGASGAVPSPTIAACAGSWIAA